MEEETEVYLGKSSYDGIRSSIMHLYRICNVEMDKDLIHLFKKSANSLGLSNIIMDSGAGHDTAQLSRVVPAGMIFIPCNKEKL